MVTTFRKSDKLLQKFTNQNFVYNENACFYVCFVWFLRSSDESDREELMFPEHVDVHIPSTTRQILLHWAQKAKANVKATNESLRENPFQPRPRMDPGVRNIPRSHDEGDEEAEPQEE